MLTKTEICCAELELRCAIIDAAHEEGVPDSITAIVLEDIINFTTARRAICPLPEDEDKLEIMDAIRAEREGQPELAAHFYETAAEGELVAGRPENARQYYAAAARLGLTGVYAHKSGKPDEVLLVRAEDVFRNLRILSHATEAFNLFYAGVRKFRLLATRQPTQIEVTLAPPKQHQKTNLSTLPIDFLSGMRADFKQLEEYQRKMK